MNRQRMNVRLSGDMAGPLTTEERKAVFIRGKRYTILPALSIHGIFAVDILEGSCTADDFYNFIVTKVVRIVSIISCIV